MKRMCQDVEDRLNAFYDGFNRLAQMGFPVGVIEPQGAIYLTVKFDLVGRKTESGEELRSMADVTSFIVREAKLAIVPFTAFGSPADSPSYRLSVGTVSMNQIESILQNVEKALSQLR